MLHHLEHGLNEGALAAMHRYWTYNEKLLAARRASGEKSSRPRIDVHVFFNSKGNFIVEWKPRNLDWSDRPDADCDWAYWRSPTGPRDHNELIYIPELRSAIRHFPGMYDPEYTPVESVMVDAILLQATYGLVKDLKRRLDLSFDVRMVSDIFVTHEELPGGAAPVDKKHVLATWTIENLDWRRKRQEREQLESFRDLVGCSLETFATAVAEARDKKPSGPTPRADSIDDRISKSMKKAGYSKLTPAVVTRYRKMVEEHRPDLIPPLPKAPASMANVLPLRKRNGNGGQEPSGGDSTTH
jgi:hypothetical protein